MQNKKCVSFYERDAFLLQNGLLYDILSNVTFLSQKDTNYERGMRNEDKNRQYEY